MAKDTVNYSIRLNRDKREQMKDIPEIADDIRAFIDRRIDAHNERENDDPIRFFVRKQLEKHGLVGAYCVYQLAKYIPNQYYEENVEVRFPEVEKASYIANRVKQDWEDESLTAYEVRKVIEDIFSEEIHEDETLEPARTSYFNRLRDQSVERIQNTEDEIEKQVFWTVLQLGKDREARNGGAINGSFSLERRSLSKSLEYGYNADEEEVERAISALVSLGAMRSHYSSNAYSYSKIDIPEFAYRALDDGLDDVKREVRAKVKEFADDAWYLEQIQQITQDDDLADRYSREDYLYRNRQEVFNDRIQEDEELSELVSDLIRDGIVVTEHSTGRRAKSGRGSTSSTLTYVLAPSVRQAIGDAIYMQQSVAE